METKTHEHEVKITKGGLYRRGRCVVCGARASWRPANRQREGKWFWTEPK